MIHSNRETEITDEVGHTEESEIVDDAVKHYEEMSASFGLAFIWDANGANAFTKLSKYETMMERSLSRLRAELERLQSAPKESMEERPVTIGHVDELDC